MKACCRLLWVVGLHRHIADGSTRESVSEVSDGTGSQSVRSDRAVSESVGYTE